MSREAAGNGADVVEEDDQDRGGGGGRGARAGGL